MSRVVSSNDFIYRPEPIGQEYTMDDGRPRRSTPSEPPRTFSRVKAERRAYLKKLLSVSSDFADSFEDLSENSPAGEKSFEQVTPTFLPSPCESKCLREWIMRMCTLEKLDKTAFDTLGAFVVAEEPEPMEQTPIQQCKARVNLEERMEPAKKKKRFSTKLFRNLSPSRRLLKQKQREEREKKEKKLLGVSDRKEGSCKKSAAGKCKKSLSRVHGLLRSFWRNAKKHTQL